MGGLFERVEEKKDLIELKEGETFGTRSEERIERRKLTEKQISQRAFGSERLEVGWKDSLGERRG